MLWPVPTPRRPGDPHPPGRGLAQPTAILAALALPLLLVSARTARAAQRPASPAPTTPTPPKPGTPTPTTPPTTSTGTTTSPTSGPTSTRPSDTTTSGATTSPSNTPGAATSPSNTPGATTSPSTTPGAATSPSSGATTSPSNTPGVVTSPTEAGPSPDATRRTGLTVFPDGDAPTPASPATPDTTPDTTADAPAPGPTAAPPAQPSARVPARKPPRVDGPYIGGTLAAGGSFARVNNFPTPDPLSGGTASLRVGEAIYPWMTIGLEITGTWANRFADPTQRLLQGAALIDLGFLPVPRIPLSLHVGFGAGGGAVRQADRTARSGFGGAVFSGAVRYEIFPLAARKRPTRGGGFSLGPELGWLGFTPAAKGRPMSNTVYIGLFMGFYFGS